VIVTLLPVVAIAAGLVPLIQRDLRMAVARRRWSRIRANVTFTIRAATFADAVRKSTIAAAEFERSMAHVRAAFGVGVADLVAFKKLMGGGGS
jgi:uncharacterized protein (DUF2235 family)